MKKVLFLVVITVLAGTVLASGVPLGLEKGMSLEEVAALLGEIPNPYASIEGEIPGHIYRVDPLTAPPEFGLFLLRITPIEGLSEIFLHTRPMIQGHVDPKAQHAKLLGMLTSRYGLPRTDPAFPTVGNKPMAGELESLASHWEPQKDGLEEIILYWRLHKSQNIISIHYKFDNWQDSRAEITDDKENR